MFRKLLKNYGQLINDIMVYMLFAGLLISFVLLLLFILD